jgi:hypothetical protein
MADPIDPQFLRIYRVLKAAIEEGEILPPKPVPHTQAAFDRTDLATGLLANNTDYPPKRKQYLFATTTSRKKNDIVFAYVTLNAHGSSQLGGSAKLVSPIDRSTFSA